MIAFLVSPLPPPVVAQWAREKMGWTRLAAKRFATPNRDDIHLIRRMSEFTPLAGTAALMLKGPGYDEAPGPEAAKEAWEQDKAQIEKFIADGGGKWIETIV